jgi:DNA helicase HerA-like ATPase
MVETVTTDENGASLEQPSRAHARGMNDGFHEDFLGLVTGESVPSGYCFVSRSDIVPPRLEYVVVRGVRERVGGRDSAIDLLGQVTGITADVVTLDDRVDFDAATVVLEHGTTFPPRVRVQVATVGYLDSSGAVRPARNAVLPGTSVYRAPDALLRRFVSRDDTSGTAIELGTLLDRPGVPVSLDVNGLSRHLAIIAQTGAGKSYLAGKVLEELLGLGATVIVLDPNSDYVQLRKLRVDADVPYDAARKVRHAERMQSFRVPIVGRQRYGDELCGPSMAYTIRFAELDGDEICDVAGVPTTAERIREAVVTACARFRRDRIEFNPPLLARELATMAGVPIESDGGPSVQPSDAVAIDELDRLAMPRELSPAGQSRRGSPGRHDGQSSLDSALASSARAALRYVRKLEKYPIWGLSTISVDALLRPMSLTVIDLAGAEKGVMAYTAEWLLSSLWQRALGGELPHPVFVVLEEAHNLVPGGREVTRASRIINTVAAEGRKFGVFLVVITQRPSKIAEDTLSQCASQLVMRLTNPDDQKAVQRASEVVSQSLLDDLPGLGHGEVVVLGRLTRIPVMVRVGGRAGAEGGADIDLADHFGRARRQLEDARAVARPTPADPAPLPAIRAPSLD